jgi:hypothetical protein
MASGANADLRQGPENPGDLADDIDAGWEDSPESARYPLTSASAPPPVVAESLIVRAVSPTSRPPAPVLSAPRPAVKQTEPVEDVRDDELLLDEAASAEDVSGERAENVSVVSAENVSSLGSGAREPATADDVAPDFRRRRAGQKLATLVGGAAALVIAISAARRFGSDPAPEAAPPGAFAQRTAERTPAPAAPVAAAPDGTPSPAPKTAEATALETAPAPITVAIKTVPDGAIIYRGRERLGAGVATVSLERNAKERFVARLDGYVPERFTLDGSRDSVTVLLRRAPKPRRAAAPKSDSPYDDEPDANPSAASVPAAPAVAEPSAAPEPEASATAAGF